MRDANLALPVYDIELMKKMFAQKAGAKLYADIQAAEKLLEAGQDGRGGDREKLLNSADGDGWTALHWAAAEGHLPMVRWLAVHKS